MRVRTACLLRSLADFTTHLNEHLKLRPADSLDYKALVGRLCERRAGFPSVCGPKEAACEAANEAVVVVEVRVLVVGIYLGLLGRWVFTALLVDQES